MEHHELPHVKKFIENADKIDDVLVMLEDMRDECGSHGQRNAAILARDTHKALALVQSVISELKKRV